MNAIMNPDGFCEYYYLQSSYQTMVHNWRYRLQMSVIAVTKHRQECITNVNYRFLSIHSPLSLIDTKLFRHRCD